MSTVPDPRIVWTFRLRGGQAFDGQVGIPDSFPSVLHHPGGAATTLWTLRLTVQEADHVLDILRRCGATVTRWGEVENEEQRAERAVLSSAERGEVIYPTVACPSCFWLDLDVPSLCGKREWGGSVVGAALEAHEKARADAEACPLNQPGNS